VLTKIRYKLRLSTRFRDLKPRPNYTCTLWTIKKVAVHLWS